MSKWDEHGIITGPNWLVDKLGNVVGYRNKLGADFQIAAQALPAGAESINPGALLSPGGAGSLYTAVSNGLVPSSGGGTLNFLRADGNWAAPPVFTTRFTTSADGIVPLSGGGTVNFLRADGTWATPPVGSTYSNFTSIAAGLVPASGGGSTAFLRADGTWSTPPGSNYSVFNSSTAGLVPSSGGGTTAFLRADGLFASPIGTTYVAFTSVAAGLTPASGGGTSTYLRADGTWATPAGSGDMSLAATQTITGAKTFNDGFFKLAGATSGTITVKAVAVAGSVTWTFPSANDTVVGLTGTQTLTNKTLTTPTIASILNGAGTLTLPSVTDTLVGRTTTDTLTNKTLAAPVITGNGTAVTQTQADNSTRIATTAYVDVLGATKASLSLFSGSVNGLVPASGGGTTTFLRADGAFASPTLTLNNPVQTTFALAIPLDLVQGREMGAVIGDVDRVFTVQSSPAAVLGGSCNLTYVYDGSHSTDLSAFSNPDSVSIGGSRGQVHELTFVQRPNAVYIFGRRTGICDIDAPTISSIAVANSTPTVVNFTFNGAVDPTSIPAASDFGITGHTTTGTVTLSGGNTIANVSVTSAFTAGESARTASYTPGTNKLRDTALPPGPNNVAAFSGTAITNNVSVPVPGAPTSLSAGSITNAGFTISFTGPTVDGSHGTPTDYVLETSPTGAGTWTVFADGTSTSTSIAVTGLSAGTGYDVRIKATNGAGAGPYSSTLVNTVTSASKVTFTDAFTGSDGSSLNVRWTPVGTGTWTVQSNAASWSGSTYGSIVATCTNGSNRVDCDITQLGGSSYAMVYIRYVDDNNLVAVQRDGSQSEKLRIISVVSGSATEHAIESSPTGYGSGGTLSIENVGNTINVYTSANGAGVYLTATVSAVSSSTKVGWGINNSHTGDTLTSFQLS